MTIEIEKIIYEEFCKLDETKFSDLYGALLVAKQKEGEFLNVLPKECHSLFQEIVKQNKFVEEQKFKDYTKYVLKFVKSFIVG